jgi:alkanesulfonate monooxygenase SsuD/methylene tetrahydromethanopterin reductase-like flavin-dependent oxidoreductase (luciferase family)
VALAATRTAGAFPYLVTTNQVREARRVLDAAADAAGQPERPLLVASLLAVLGQGPDVAAAARGSVTRYLAQPNYRANLLRGGILAEEIEAVADPLVRALVATGDADDLRERIAAMRAAGADHVAVIPLSPAGRQADLATARAVAPAG